MFFARSLFIASAVGSALAQFSNVSAQCKSAIIAVAADSRAECLNPNGLLQVFLQGTNSSIVSPVDTWLKGLCSRGSCSNDSLEFIVTNVTGGCASDLQSVLGTTQPGSLTPLVEQIYPTARKAVCLADTSNNNELCVTETLSSVETVTGNLTINKLLQIVPAVVSGNTSSLNGVNLCTPCTKQIYDIAKTDLPAMYAQGDIASKVKATCGASFLDGDSDPKIVQTASNTATSGKSNNADSSVQLSGQQALLSAFLLALLAL